MSNTDRSPGLSRIHRLIEASPEMGTQFTEADSALAAIDRTTANLIALTATINTHILNSAEQKGITNGVVGLSGNSLIDTMQSLAQEHNLTNSQTFQELFGAITDLSQQSQNNKVYVYIDQNRTANFGGAHIVLASECEIQSIINSRRIPNISVTTRNHPNLTTPMSVQISASHLADQSLQNRLKFLWDIIPNNQKFDRLKGISILLSSISHCIDTSSQEDLQATVEQDSLPVSPIALNYYIHRPFSGDFKNLTLEQITRLSSDQLTTVSNVFLQYGNPVHRTTCVHYYFSAISDTGDEHTFSVRQDLIYPLSFRHLHGVEYALQNENLSEEERQRLQSLQQTYEQAIKTSLVTWLNNYTSES